MAACRWSPIAAGCADTVIDANEAGVSARGSPTGIQFHPGRCRRSRRGAEAGALRLYADPPAWESLEKRGMKHDVSWHKSAARYAGIYKSLAGGERIKGLVCPVRGARPSRAACRFRRWCQRRRRLPPRRADHVLPFRRARRKETAPLRAAARGGRRLLRLRRRARAGRPLRPAGGRALRTRRTAIGSIRRSCSSTPMRSPSTGPSPTTASSPRRAMRDIDTAPLVPKAIVTARRRRARRDRRASARLRSTRSRSRAFTALHPDVPRQLRGTVAALAHPAISSTSSGSASTPSS